MDPAVKAQLEAKQFVIETKSQAFSVHKIWRPSRLYEFQGTGIKWVFSGI
jgi:hypothetical protein